MLIFDLLSHFPENFPYIKTIISAFVAFVLGILWYHPLMMGQKLEEVLDKEALDYSPPFYVYIAIGAMWIITAFVYTFLTSFLTPPAVGALLGLSTFLWIGFVLPAIMLNGLFTGKKLMVMAVDSSYFLAALYLIAVIHDVL